jgi:hypothetical protein
LIRRDFSFHPARNITLVFALCYAIGFCCVSVLECEQARRNVKARSMRWSLLSVVRVYLTWFGLPVLLAGGLGIALLVGIEAELPR